MVDRLWLPARRPVTTAGGHQPGGAHPVAADSGERRAVAVTGMREQFPDFYDPTGALDGAEPDSSLMLPLVEHGRSEPARRAGSRDQPAPTIRCGLPRLLPPGRRSCLDRGHRCPGLEAERVRVAALAEIDAAKTRFFQNISHELRTPLTLVLGSAAAGARAIRHGATGRATGTTCAARRAARGCNGWSTACSTSPGARSTGWPRPPNPPTSAPSPGFVSMFRSGRSSRPGLPLMVRCCRPACRPRGSADVVADRARPALERGEVHPAGGITVESGSNGRDLAELTVRDTGIGIPESGDPVDLRPVPPGRRSARADRRGRGHRAVAGRRSGAGARRHDQGGQRPRRR